MKKIIVTMLALVLIPLSTFAGPTFVNSINGTDSTITCSPTLGNALCKVNQQSDFFFGGTFFGIDTGSAVSINPAILWLTNDLPMFTFGAEDGHEGFNISWDEINGYIKTKDHYGNDVPQKGTFKDSVFQGTPIRPSPDGTCWNILVSNSGALSTASTTCL